MTPIVYLDSAVFVQIHTREQRIREYVATVLPIPPDDSMTMSDVEDELNTHDPAEVNTVYNSDIWGPSSDIIVDA